MIQNYTDNLLGQVWDLSLHQITQIISWPEE
jgi:hypothetical protein